MRPTVAIAILTCVLALGGSAAAERRFGAPPPNLGAWLALKRINPGGPSAPGRSMNCVFSAVATDASIAGLPVMALPSDTPVHDGVVERLYGRSFVRGTRAHLELTLRLLGSGARALVAHERPGGVGHLYNAVNDHGVIRYLDGQAGEFLNGDEMPLTKFLVTSP